MPVPIPEGLAALPPGAELALALDGIDESRVSGFDTVEVLKAAYRQLCHDRARFLAVLLEVGLREQFSGQEVHRLEIPDEFSPDEARAALVWSRRRADSTFERAWDIHRRLPHLGEAMLAGALDEPRAAAFIQWTAGLTPEQAASVCDRLVPAAGQMTVGQLIEQIQRLVLAIDPDWARKRYNESLRRRRVVGTRNPDGTATVSGLDLPLHRAAAGCERIDELARACKRSGDKRPIDHIRTDLFLGLLDGTFETLTDQQIITHVLAHPFHDPNDTPTPAPDATRDPNSESNSDGGGDTDRNGNGDDGDRADGTGDEGDGSDGGGHNSDGNRSDGDGDGDGGDGDRGDGTGGSGGSNHISGDTSEDGGGNCDGEISASEDGGANFDGVGSGSGQDEPGSAPNTHDGRTAEPHAPSRHASKPYTPGRHATRQQTPARPNPVPQPPAEPPAERQASSESALTETTAPEPGAIEVASTPEPGPTEHGPTEPGPIKSASAQSSSPEPGPDRSEPEDGLSVHRAPDTRDHAASAPSGKARGWSVREIRVELTTLLHLDERPAEIPGWGMIHADLARTIVADMLSGEWRYAICTNNGKLLHTGITGRRPCAPNTRPPRQTRRKGGIVELQITATRLHELAHNPTRHRWWAPLINDLARQHDKHDKRDDTIESATPTGATLRRTRTRNAAANTTTDTTTDPDADADKRRPGAALRRYVQIRGRVCSWPGCRTPATTTDQDHAIDHAAGGATLDTNLHLACRHDHRAKHHGGWQVTMPQPDTVLWTSPLGHPYAGRIPPIITTLPDPRPRNHPDLPPDRITDHDEPTLTEENPDPPDRSPATSPDRPSPLGPNDDPPPF
ncbi:DUF222 domain-containing protein [Planotetraspora thailandica]|uniref:HNH endonuclease signature motif containing protein n=1 Tax=Planotetraspora thailandica TaxID=487172 RepID=UPI0035E5D0AF